jgi:hypothetical protein
MPKKGDRPMVRTSDDQHASFQPKKSAEASDEAGNWSLHRWQVSFRSGKDWYPIGEFIALDATMAIEQAVEIFGPGEVYQAEIISWDAGPLPRVNTPRQRGAS